MKIERHSLYNGGNRMKNKMLIICIVVAIIVIGLVMIIVKDKNKDIQINIEDLASKIAENNYFEDQLEKVDSEMIMEAYNFSSDEIEKLASYQGSGASSEEIVILQVKDKSKLNSVKDKINKRLEERKEAFASYLPNEVYKLENPVLIIKDKYIILCICNNSQNMSEYIEKYLKTV